MKTQHTPGPWVFLNNTLCQDIGNRLHLGTWSESPGLKGAAECNKTLIESAPELLALLEDIRTIPVLQGTPVMAHILAVIAKAKGEQK